MLCKNCGKENIDDAVFCTSCGERLDNAKTCPSCGKVLQEDAVYCNYCGKRVDGKNLCPACGELFEGNFCPKCGTSVVERPVSEPQQSKKINRAKLNEKVNKVLDKTGASVLLFGVVFALIFVFLIGFKVSMKASIAGVSVDSLENLFDEFGVDLGLKTKLNMYYYFGDAYKDIDETIQNEGLREMPVEYTSPALYIEAILGTVIVSCVLLAVFIMSIVAMVKLVNKLRGKDVKNAEKVSLATMLTYILGAIALYALNYAKAYLSYDSLSVSAFVKFDSATLAGIILCAISIGLAFICYLLRNRESYKKFQNVIPSAIGLVSAVFVTIVSAFASSGVFKYFIKEGGSSVSLNTSAFPFILKWASYLQTNTEANTDTYAKLIALAVFQIVLITLAIVSLIKQISYIAKDEKKSSWGINIAMLIVSVSVLSLAMSARTETLNTLMTADAAQVYNPSTGMFESPKLNHTLSATPSIICLVFSVLALATSVVQKVLPLVLPKSEESNSETVA